ncbi:MAG: hypothetical protein ACOYJZ_07430 [Acutalibacter sp.]|jgi:flagellar hook-associated protein 3 FlgL
MNMRVTTTGVLKSYQTNLMHASNTLNDARNTVLTQRNFNSFAEDPASATQAFQLRRSFMRVNSQSLVSSSLVGKFEAGWSALTNVQSMAKSALSDVLEAKNDPTASGLNSLGIDLEQLAQSMVQTMNTKYGENFVFAGADGLNVPFELKEGDDGTMQLYYRGVAVDSPTGSDEYNTLAYLSGETSYLDIGLGMQENNDGELIESSAYNESLPGINYLGGYGVDDDGDPKNVVSLMYRMADLLKNCSADGEWQDNDKEEYDRLAGKFEAAVDNVSVSYVELDAQARFIKDNDTQLDTTAYNLNEQILGLEQVDLADAISSYSWAQYCYNAALKMGNSILGQSLMDYIST